MLPAMAVVAISADRAAGRHGDGDLHRREPAGGRGAGHHSAGTSRQYRSGPALHQLDERARRLDDHLHVQPRRRTSTSLRPTCKTPSSRRSDSSRPPCSSSASQVAKNSGAFVMGIALTSDNKTLDTLTLSNYAQLNIVNNLTRVPGVSQVIIFGQRQYAMRIWLNPIKLQQQGLDASDVVSALQEQNAAVAAGSIGAPPSRKNQPYTYTVNALTQLSSPSQFANIILRANPNGGFVRLGDVARIELGAQSYTTDLRFDGKRKSSAWACCSIPTPTRSTSPRRVTPKMQQLAPQFPTGMHWDSRVRRYDSSSTNRSRKSSSRCCSRSCWSSSSSSSSYSIRSRRSSRRRRSRSR